MFGLDDAIIFGKAGVSLIPGIVEVIKKVRKSEDDPSIQRILDQLQTDTRESCKRLSEETRNIERSLKELDVNPSKTLSEISEDLSWYQFGAKQKLSKHKRALRQIEENLSSSVDDFVSVLICAGRVPGITEANKISKSIKRKFDGMEEKPIEEVLETFREIIDEYINELR